jgi:hypothetical protein
LITWNILQASAVASGRWSNSGGGLLAIFCDGFRDSFGAVPFSGIGALSAADFASSGDMLGARESGREPFGVREALLSSFFNLTPLDFGLSSVPDPATVPDGRLLPSMAAAERAHNARSDGSRT